MENRIQQLAAGLPDGIDGVLITSEPNRQYFTGMHSSAGTVLVFKNGAAYFFIDSRYVERARQLASGYEVILQKELYAQLAEKIREHQAGKIAIESEAVTVSEYMRMKNRLQGIHLVMEERVNAQIRRMRMLKSAEEIAAIKAAQQLTEEAFAHICGYIKAGMTDRQIAGELLDYTYRHGSERPAFDYIVVSGKHSSMPHGVPTDKIVEPGDFITMDYGCVVDGYCSDMTRTVAVGQVSREQEEIYQIVLQAQQAAIQAVHGGARCAQVDQAARDIIAGRGYGDCFGHSTGHSLGLEIHELPTFSPRDFSVCEPGMVITVEPGIYLEGKFGVRIEDMVLVTEAGCENLTAAPKNLLCL